MAQRRRTPFPAFLHKHKGEMKGYCERMVALDAGNVVQFERIGFVRIEKATAIIIEAYWGHSVNEFLGFEFHPTPPSVCVAKTCD
jgi:hypothetical protein